MIAGEFGCDNSRVESYFAVRQLSVKRVLRLVGKVLLEKVADGKDGAAWPLARDELFVSAAELRKRIDEFLEFAPYFVEPQHD